VFEALSERLQGVFRTLRGQGVLSEAQIDAALREIRLALLEADVHFRVTKELVERVRARATGQEILKSLTPDQAVLRLVRDEMTSVLGGAEPRPLTWSSRVPSVILMTGLQGSGKTTTTAKLGRWLKGRGRHPLLVSTDVQRPAAREQLRSLGAQAGVPVHHPATASPRQLLESALAEARALGHDTVIVDTAGRLHIDDALMAELAELRQAAEPAEVLYVADALTGQDAVRSADEFHRRIGITGIVLTKLDGDARGGAALSAAAVTGRPVKSRHGEGGRVRAVRSRAHGGAPARDG
jgi:signal recognition particle subunit SRP54